MRLKVRLDEYLDCLFAGVDFNADRRIAEIHFVPAVILSPDDGVRHFVLLPINQRCSQPSRRPDDAADNVTLFGIVLVDYISRANQRIRPMTLTSSPLPSQGLQRGLSELMQ